MQTKQNETTRRQLYSPFIHLDTRVLQFKGVTIDTFFHLLNKSLWIPIGYRK